MNLCRSLKIISIFPTSDTLQGSYYQLFSFSHSFPVCQLFLLFLQHTPTCFTFHLSCFFFWFSDRPFRHTLCFRSVFTLTLQLFFSLSLLSTFLLLFISRQLLLMPQMSTAAGMLSLSSLHQTSILWNFTSVFLILSGSLGVKWHSQGPWVILAALTYASCATRVSILSFHNNMRQTWWKV